MARNCLIVRCVMKKIHKAPWERIKGYRED